MDVSFLIATKSTNHNIFLRPVLESMMTGVPDDLKVEIVVVADQEIPNLPKNAKFVHEGESTGSCGAYNLAAANSTGTYISSVTDDFVIAPRWWDVIEFMKDIRSPVASLYTGSMLGIPVSYLPFVSRELYEGDLMRKHLFNPAYYHCYIDNDLAFRLSDHGIGMPNFPKLHHIIQTSDSNKHYSKTKYFRVDGMMFNKIWGHKPGLSALCPLYGEATQPDDVLEKDANERVANDIYRDLY